MIILSDNEIEFLSKAGSLAPSGGNSQSWVVNIDNNSLNIKLNPKHLHSVPYTYLTGNIFSLGMFAENICIASDTLGLEYILTIADTTKPEDLWIRFEYTQRNTNKHASLNDSLMPCLARRAANRKPHTGGTLSSELIRTLESSFASMDSPCLLTLFEEQSKKQSIVECLATAEAIRMKNTGLFRGMLSEIRWNNTEAEQTRDGIDVATLECSKADLLPLLIMKKLPFLTKILPSSAFKRPVRQYMLSASHIGCVTIPNPFTYKRLVLAGKASQYLWLRATQLGIALQPWTSFPFMHLQANYKGGFNEKEQSKINALYCHLQKNIYNSTDKFPIFIFRLFKANAPSARSLRRDWKSYTYLHRDNNSNNMASKNMYCPLETA